MSIFEEFDHYCEENDIKPGEEGAAFAAFLHQQTGWDGKAEPLPVPERVTPVSWDGPDGARYYRDGPLVTWPNIVTAACYSAVLVFAIALLGAVFLGWRF